MSSPSRFLSPGYRTLTPQSAAAAAAASQCEQLRSPTQGAFAASSQNNEAAEFI